MTPIRTIAVGYDGSPGAQAAARFAFELAGQLGAKVVLIHAVGMLGRTDDAQVVRDLEETALVLADDVGLDAGRSRWHVSQGDPCSALLRAARPPIEADLVVVGSRGHRNDAGLPLGSTSHELAEHASVPLVIVPGWGGPA
jgi:nucleotide-binding universal stress UspA family protein